MVNKRGVKVPDFGKPKEKQRLSKPAVSKPVPSSPERPKTPEQALPPLRKGADVVPTGIPGLDEVMGGGFEEGSVNLVSGGPGAGKSIFCVQFLVNGVRRFKEPGVYITFEETKQKMYKHMAIFGWDLAQMEREGRFALIEYTPEQVKKLLAEGGGEVDAVIEKMGAKRIVIDSITAFNLLFKGELERREASLALFKLLSKWGCTALLTAEEEPDPDRHATSIMEFEVDGVILLYNIRKGDVRERSLEVLKLRGIKHSSRIFPMKISKEGMRIYPEEAVF